MGTNLIGFKRFFFEDMDPSMDKKMGGKESPKDDTGMDYFSGLGEEMGMEWKDIVTAMSGEPWISSHFGLGSPKHEIMYKKSGWKIVPGSMTQNGADIMLVPNKGDRSYLAGGKMLNKGTPDTKRYHLNPDDLIGFLTGGWQPAVDAAKQGAAGGGGMPMM